ncbi:MAG: bifunctional riboflavin kinase/FAD synthetase [Candidatus Omnitrophica bacterium]|nr:bifunctional riboflavin kinase/FAD synthetase [Candidatus Omnitrophota bacterium]
MKFPRPVAAIGIFDGVHRGHQAILKKAVRRGRALRGTPVAVTFDPHPLTVLAPGKEPPLLLSISQRLKAFRRLGIQKTLVLRFTRAFSRLSPEDFVRRILLTRLAVREVVVGHDFGFGRGRSGTVETLQQFGRRFGFKVHVVAPVKRKGERIASNRIRERIRRGELKKAREFLGYPVTVSGRVVRGSSRGRGLGFPTANLKVEAGVLPPTGVYAVRAKVGLRRFAGMANLGFRPTFEKGKRKGGPVLEAHLFGLRQPLGGRRLELEFLKRLRPERRFPSARALIRQLEADARRARRG